MIANAIIELASNVSIRGGWMFMLYKYMISVYYYAVVQKNSVCEYSW